MSGSSADGKTVGRDPGKPHILFLMDGIYCIHGGTEKVLLTMIDRLPKDKYRCSLGLLDRLNPDSGAENLPCPVYEFPLRRTYDWKAVKMAAKLSRFIRSENVSIVHTFFETSDLWGGLVAKLSGCPVLISARRDMGIMRSSKHRIAYRLLNPWVDLVTAVSEEVRTYCIQEDRVPPEKVVTLYNGVELEKIVGANSTESIRDEFGLGGASHVVTTVANVRRVKGIDIFIQAARIVRQEFPKALFLIVGFAEEQDHYADLQELVKSLGLTENVKFLGSTNKVFSLLKLTDVFCLLSRSEGFSNALLEAMAAGVPSVATLVGGNAEAVVNSQNGFLIAPEDVTAAADRISLLLREPETARRIGQAGHQTVAARFTNEVMMSQLMEVYDALYLAKRRR
jgi:glycosyltransferase involved in cell wall biosynthesis